MCLAYRVNISPVSRLSPKSLFVGCGKCEECRKVCKSSWCFRLQAEIDYCLKRKYRVLFFTLTYNDQSLPRLTEDVFRQGVDIRPEWLNLPCFSRDDVEHFVHAVREWLWREFDYKEVVYFGAGEFGSKTKRPHYHFLMAVPDFVDCRKLHSFIVQWWAEDHAKGHVFPRYFEGGVDSHGYKHKPFVVSSPQKASRYCAKYATKDLYYDEFLVNSGLSSTELDTGSRSFRRKMVFHVQKRSLGACFLQDLSDKDKLDMLKVGYAFAWDSKFHRIPVYIKNKLIYDNDYQYETAVIAPPSKGKELGIIALQETYTFRRVVRKKANEFFKTYAKEIFEAKVLVYSDFFRQLSDENQYLARGISPEFAYYGSRCMGHLLSRYSSELCAKMYLLYDGVKPDERYYVPQGDEWLLYLLRYIPDVPLDDLPYQVELPVDIDYCLQLVDFAISCYFITPISRTEAQCLEDRIVDFFGHLE